MHRSLGLREERQHAPPDSPIKASGHTRHAGFFIVRHALVRTSVEMRHEGPGILVKKVCPVLHRCTGGVCLDCELRATETAHRLGSREAVWGCARLCGLYAAVWGGVGLYMAAV